MFSFWKEPHIGSLYIKGYYKGQMGATRTTFPVKIKPKQYCVLEGVEEISITSRNLMDIDVATHIFSFNLLTCTKGE
jgi:hypothetical protein